MFIGLDLCAFQTGTYNILLVCIACSFEHSDALFFSVIISTRASWVVLTEKFKVFYNLYYVKTTKSKLNKWY